MFFTLFLLSGGFMLIYKIQQHQVQIEMQSTLSKDHVETEKIILSNSDFQKNKINSREIILLGKLYDIRSVIHTGKDVELQVINDTREENILEKISNLVRNTGNGHDQLPNCLVQLLTMEFICPEPSCHFFNNDPTTCSHQFNELIISVTSNVVSPPPELG